MNAPAAPLHEVFYSLQGEGLWVGVPQLFVRVRGCDLTCLYCDTAAARDLHGPASFWPPGGAPALALDNPVPLGDLLALVDQWRAAAPLHSLALTGGEPLLYPAFVQALGEALARRRLPLYLETAGHLPEALAEVLPMVACAALDYKLPHTLAEPVAPERFLRSAEVASGGTYFVKIVVTSLTPQEELEAAARGLAQVAPLTPVVLQPVTGALSAGATLALRAWGRCCLNRVSERNGVGRWEQAWRRGNGWRQADECLGDRGLHQLG